MLPIYLIVSGFTPAFCLSYKLRNHSIGHSDVTYGMLGALFAVVFNTSWLICGEYKVVRI